MHLLQLQSVYRICVSPFDLDRFAERKAEKMLFDHILHLRKTACILGFDFQRQRTINRLEPACSGRKRDFALDGHELNGQLMRKMLERRGGQISVGSATP